MLFPRPEYGTFPFLSAVLPLPGAMKHFSLFISKILCVRLVGFLQGGRVMISRSQRPTRSALNQRGGSGGFRPAQMSFISSRSVAFKMCYEQFNKYLFSLALVSTSERGCAEFFVGIDHVNYYIVGWLLVWSVLSPDVLLLAGELANAEAVQRLF